MPAWARPSLSPPRPLPRQRTRFTAATGSGTAEDSPREGGSPCLGVATRSNITPEEDPGLVAVMFMALNGQTEIPDEDLVHFFDDFYID